MSDVSWLIVNRIIYYRLSNVSRIYNNHDSLIETNLRHEGTKIVEKTCTKKIVKVILGEGRKNLEDFSFYLFPGDTCIHSMLSIISTYFYSDSFLSERWILSFRTQLDP